MLQHQDRVSVGSFVTTSTGPLILRWETAAGLARYPHLGVTLEPDNGSPLHQGARVLTGP
jgi:anti-sigma-K factor RskA